MASTMATTTATTADEPPHPSPPQSDTPDASSDLPTTPTRPHEPAGPGNPSLFVSTQPRPRVVSITVPTTSSVKQAVKRKPLPPTASALSNGLSSFSEPLPDPFVPRSYEVDSPTLYDNPLTPRSLPAETSSPCATDQEKQRDSSKTSGETITLTTSSALGDVDCPREGIEPLSLYIFNRPDTPSSSTTTKSVTPHEKNNNDVLTRDHTRTRTSSTSASSESNPLAATPQTDMSMFSTRPTPPHLALPRKSSLKTLTNNATANPITNKPPTPSLNSPSASKLGSFFGWGGSNSPNSPTTSLSSPESPEASPKKSIQRQPSSTGRSIPPGIDTKRANATHNDYLGDSYLTLPQFTPVTAQIQEMEDELKTISSELATSIRREMDLEDLVERLQSEAANTQGQGRRTSDYFSDSGTSSIRYAGESDSKSDELDRLQRKAEREKAQIRLELQEKVQDERTHRKVLESQIRTLEEKVSKVDLVSMNSMDNTGRLKELENTCEDLRRRLGEERRVKDNFEDLLTALKSELQNSHNERDNLRDEIVPQLRSRVEGLEAQTSEHEKLTYENTKMQQEMQSLRDENATLANARRLQSEMQQQMTRFNGIAEGSPPITPQGGNLSISNSPAQRFTRPGSPTRSPSVKGTESREALAERVKDIELQRDALHSALKSLLDRQEHQNRENEKKLRQLEIERDRVLSISPRRMGYDRDVANLREEINVLRRRADEAIEQKWQSEKGLSGLKMDLDRSEQEIASLRSFLESRDILTPSGRRDLSGDHIRNNSISSATLEKSFKDLKINYLEALGKIKELEDSGPANAETERAMKALEKSLSIAIHERDFARQEAEELRHTVDSLHTSERGQVSSELSLADELRSSAKRVEELATQVRQQMASNATLRQRLAETIERGEREQKANASRIVHMQGKLRSLEEAMLASQQASEECVSKHEEEIQKLKDNHSAQLVRVKDGLRSPRSFSPRTPLTPLFANGAKSPRLDFTSTGKGVSIEEQTQTDFLKRRVIELEKALEEADSEMEEVVGKMNVAQIEVMELQNEREEAVRETRRLQLAVEKEKLNNFQERFASLSS